MNTSNVISVIVDVAMTPRSVDKLHTRSLINELRIKSYFCLNVDRRGLDMTSGSFEYLCLILSTEFLSLGVALTPRIMEK